MVDERRRVIADLLVRLEEAGIKPETRWTATYLPGLGWAFEAEPEAGSSSSSAAGGAHVPTKGVRSQDR